MTRPRRSARSSARPSSRPCLRQLGGELRGGRERHARPRRPGDATRPARRRRARRPRARVRHGEEHGVAGQARADGDRPGLLAGHAREGSAARAGAARSPRSTRRAPAVARARRVGGRGRGPPRPRARREAGADLRGGDAGAQAGRPAPAVRVAPRAPAARQPGQLHEPRDESDRPRDGIPAHGGGVRERWNRRGPQPPPPGRVAGARRAGRRPAASALRALRKGACLDGSLRRLSARPRGRCARRGRAWPTGRPP
jgi:hypothetical protein